MEGDGWNRWSWRWITIVVFLIIIVTFIIESLWGHYEPITIHRWCQIVCKWSGECRSSKQYCLHHIVSNFNNRFKNPKLKMFKLFNYFVFMSLLFVHFCHLQLTTFVACVPSSQYLLSLKGPISSNLKWWLLVYLHMMQWHKSERLNTHNIHKRMNESIPNKTKKCSLFESERHNRSNCSYRQDW